MWFERLQAWWRRLRGVAQPEPRVAPGAGPGVVVRKRKYDGRIKSEWEGELLLSPGEGWLVVLHHPARHRKRSAGKWKLQSPVHVHCLHTASPLTVLLTYAEDGTFREAKCDAALPAVRDGHVIEFVDLDLDLIVAPDLTRSLRDEDTFKRNRMRWGYPEHVVTQAQTGITLAQELLATRRFPFGPGLNREWFEAGG